MPVEVSLEEARAGRITSDAVETDRNTTWTTGNGMGHPEQQEKGVLVVWTR